MSETPGGGSRSRIRHPLIWFWIYTALRVGVFGVLFGVFWLVGVRHLLGAALALALSVPLSYALLARPRAALAAALHDRLVLRQQRTETLDADLSGGSDSATDRAVQRKSPDGPGGFPNG